MDAAVAAWWQQIGLIGCNMMKHHEARNPMFPGLSSTMAYHETAGQLFYKQMACFT
jgi:hypothetical protein